jgi:hypothetical protein
MVKFSFWTVVAIALMFYAWQCHTTGKLAAWFYHSASTDGYAVNADSFKNATAKAPATLAITTTKDLQGLVAVKVKKGDLLPANANGVISEKEIKSGKRVALEGDTLKVKVPWQIKEAKGFKYKDDFKHKGVETWPWGAVWNVFMIIATGLALGFMAEGFTDVLGMKVEKIQHHGH